MSEQGCIMEEIVHRLHRQNHWCITTPRRVATKSMTITKAKRSPPKFIIRYKKQGY